MLLVAVGLQIILVVEDIVQLFFMVTKLGDTFFLTNS